MTDITRQDGAHKPPLLLQHIAMGIANTPSNPTSLICLTERSGRIAAKTFEMTECGIECRPYDDCYRFSVSSIQTEDIEELAGAIRRLSRMTSTLVIRGTPVASCNIMNTRRLKLPDKETGDPATFTECPRMWALFDYDGKPQLGAPDLVKYPSEAVEYILSTRPIEMQEASYVWQLGNSAGIKSKYTIHLWTLIDRPVGGEALRRYYADTGFDPALAEPIQPHYTAKPRFIGMTDPVQQRIGIRRGRREYMDASPILAAGRSVQLEKLIKDREHLRAKAIRELRTQTSSTARYATVADIMTGPYSHIITEECTNGWIHCDCPRHTSSSHTSLHINIDTGQWRCHGCATSGKTAWGLAMFLAGEDRDKCVDILRTARPGGVK